MQLISIYSILSQLINLYQMVIVIYCLMSWLPNARQSRLGSIIAGMAEPYLSLFRRVIPPMGGIDFSPIIAIFVLNLAQRGLFMFLSMLVR